MGSGVDSLESDNSWELGNREPFHGFGYVNETKGRKKDPGPSHSALCPRASSGFFSFVRAAVVCRQTNWRSLFHRCPSDDNVGSR